jgi:hypothetical protein
LLRLRHKGDHKDCPYTTNNAGAQAMQFDFNEEKNQLLLHLLEGDK